MGELKFNAPPTLDIQNAIRESVSSYLDDIDKQHVKGGVFTVATRDASGNIMVNAVLAVKVNQKVEIAGWIGKTWGSSLEGGVEGKFYF